MAFGTILDGPDPDKLKPLVIEAMPYLINSLENPKIEGLIYFFYHLKM